MSPQNDLNAPQLALIARRIRRVPYLNLASELSTTLRGFENPNHLRKSARAAVGLNAKQHEAASFALTQARYFFEAARAANDAVRPLVLYYGAMNFAKTLGILSAVTMDPDNFSRHGLTPVRPVRDLRRAKVHVKDKGVVRLLIESTPYTDVQVFGPVGPQWTNRHVLEMPTATFSVLRGKRFSLAELATRVPELRTHVFDVLGVKPHTFPGHIRYEPLGGTPPKFLVQFVIRIGERIQASSPSEKWVAQKLSARHRGWKSHPRDGSTVIFEQTTDKPGSSKRIPLYSSLNGDTFFVIPLAGGIPHEIVIHFMLLFLLGSIVRYEPTAWQRVVYRQPEVLGLITRFMDLTTDKFPAMVLNLLAEECRFFVPPTEKEVV